MGDTIQNAKTIQMTRMGGNYWCCGFHIVLGFSYCVVCGIVIKVNEQDTFVISSQIASIFVIIKSICLSIYMSICPSIYLSICLSFYLFIYQFVYHSIYLSINSSICLSIHLAIYLTKIFLKLLFKWSGFFNVLTNRQ